MIDMNCGLTPFRMLTVVSASVDIPCAPSVTFLPLHSGPALPLDGHSWLSDG